MNSDRLLKKDLPTGVVHFQNYIHVFSKFSSCNFKIGVMYFQNISYLCHLNTAYYEAEAVS